MTSRDVHELTCKEVVELVTDYLEEALSPVTRRRFDEHMASCPYCQAYLEQMRQTIRTLGCLPEETIPPKALDALLDHFRRWR
jgi:predicted anti-sigma-YlaC factor YlaD